MSLVLFKTCRVASSSLLCLQTSTQGERSSLDMNIVLWQQHKVLVLHSTIHLCFVIHIISTTRSCLLGFVWGWCTLCTIFFFFWLTVTYMNLLTFKNTKIYYVCSYSRKAFAHVVAVISICYLHCDFVVPHTSNKVISIHEIQVNNIRSNKQTKRRYSRTSCIMQCEKQKTTRTSTKGNS